jgi:hypothetical protein
LIPTTIHDTLKSLILSFRPRYALQHTWLCLKVQNDPQFSKMRGDSLLEVVAGWDPKDTEGFALWSCFWAIQIHFELECKGINFPIIIAVPAPAGAARLPMNCSVVVRDTEYEIDCNKHLLSQYSDFFSLVFQGSDISERKPVISLSEENPALLIKLLCSLTYGKLEISDLPELLDLVKMVKKLTFSDEIFNAVLETVHDVAVPENLFEVLELVEVGQENRRGRGLVASWIACNWNVLSRYPKEEEKFYPFLKYFSCLVDK